MRYINARNTAYGEDRRSYKTGTDGVTSSQTVFNVSYDNGRVEAYLNGVRLYPGDDFTKTSSGIGTSITLASAIGASNVLEIVGYQGINSGNALVEDNFVVGTGSTGSGGSYTNSTTVFPVASSAGDTVSVWRNGIKLVPTTDYTVSVSAQTVTLGSAASSADEITVHVVGALIHNNLVQKENASFNSGNNTFTMPTTRGSDDYVLTRDDSAGTGGTAWKETLVVPSIISVTGEINEDTNTTLTVTGTGFASGMTIKLINSSTGADITGHTTLSYTGSSSPLTVTIPSATTSITAGTSVKLHITKSGLTTESNAIVVSEDPNWSTSAGNITTIYSNRGTSTNVGSALSATAGSGGGTINYVIDSSDTSATTYFDLGLTSGQITTDASNALSGLIGSANSATETFIAYAQIAGEEATKKTPRTFNIIINKPPTEPSGVTAVDWTHPTTGVVYRVIKFVNTSSTFTTYSALTIDYLVIGGGGGGGNNSGSAGGGAGAFRTATGLSLSSAGAYTIEVGNGGAYGTAYNATATNGNPSRIKDPSNNNLIEAIGGGGGGGQQTNGGNGGSGGGGGESYTKGTASNSSYGNDGGDGGPSYYGGGGGGAGADGSDGSGSTSGGEGGNGATDVMGENTSNSTSLLKAVLAGTDSSNVATTSSTSGTIYIAGGGGGMRQSSSTRSPGGLGGGSKGGYYTDTSTNAGATDPVANTGSGGGGAHPAYNTAGGGMQNGASGIVIVRYAI